jgi:hypothetical protein
MTTLAPSTGSNLASFAKFARPQLDPAARYGLAGEVVAAIEPHSESDPAALLADFLTMFGNRVGPDAAIIIEGAGHPARHYTLLVGPTGTGRKGTSHDNNVLIFDRWSGAKEIGGLSSGEGLLQAIQNRGYNKNVLAYEPEFARVLRVMERRGNTISDILRTLWDRGYGATTVRANPIEIDDVHLSIIAHITPTELRSLVRQTDVMNGFINRFLLVYSERSKLLPLATGVPAELRKQLNLRVERAIDLAGRVWEMSRSSDASEMWVAAYPGFHPETEGLAAAAVARAEAHVARLSVTYALTDGSEVIEAEHLAAALALWRYCTDTARMVFDKSSGDLAVERDLNRIEQVLLATGPNGITLTELQGRFSNHMKELRGKIGKLVEQGRAFTEEEETGGAPRLRCYHPANSSENMAK